ncbi:MAG TPA: hypothetical protein DCY79_06720 [Planctomycetaceae bacterium]|nr:hypothetical protein [Blastopirellula sp.]HAY79481.1 hypothetical protein [Planctomycetaceae bacterium]
MAADGGWTCWNLISCICEFWRGFFPKGATPSLHEDGVLEINLGARLLQKRGQLMDRLLSEIASLRSKTGSKHSTQCRKSQPESCRFVQCRDSRSQP